MLYRPIDLKKQLGSYIKNSLFQKVCLIEKQIENIHARTDLNSEQRERELEIHSSIQLDVTGFLWLKILKAIEKNMSYIHYQDNFEQKLFENFSHHWGLSLEGKVITRVIPKKYTRNAHIE